MEDPPLPGACDRRFTMRLRLEPAGPANGLDLWLVSSDDEVSPWYGNQKPNPGQAEQWAKFMGDSWRLHGGPQVDRVRPRERTHHPDRDPAHLLRRPFAHSDP
jgi:hypothetical protein